MKAVGRSAVFSEDDEQAVTSGLISASIWNFPQTSLDLRCIIKSYLDSYGLIVPFFKQNFPGVCWTRSFLKRHKDDLPVRLSKNIKHCQSSINNDLVTKYHDELKATLHDVNPEAIINYDETNFTDDSGKHAERIIDKTKSSTSVMFCGTATGI